jgi:3-deoxy-D-arabino-heptulosonate 7-phosphate (DAHP) synthase
VEAHPAPALAWSDADQAIDLDDLHGLVRYSRQVSARIGE